MNNGKTNSISVVQYLPKEGSKAYNMLKKCVEKNGISLGEAQAIAGIGSLGKMLVNKLITSNGDKVVPTKLGQDGIAGRVTVQRGTKFVHYLRELRQADTEEKFEAALAELSEIGPERIAQVQARKK